MMMSWLRRWREQYRQTVEDARYARGGLIDMGVPPPVPMPESSRNDPVEFVDYDG
jgi:hypothetical protein